MERVDFMDINYLKSRTVGSLYTESATDYVLPDYQGDVKKVLSTCARIIPSGKFIGDGEVQFAGIVDIRVLYADADGKLTEASFGSDYEIAHPLKGATLADASADLRVSNLSIRLLGPRKLTAKCGIGARLTLCENAALVTEGDALDGAAMPQTAQKTVKIRKTILGTEQEREYAEEAMRIEGVRAEDVEIVCTFGNVRIDEVCMTASGACARGSLSLGAIVRTPDQPPFPVRKSVPFEEMLPIDGADEGMCATADGCCTSVTAHASEGEQGDAILTMSAIVSLSAEAECNQPIAVVTDGFLTECETQNRYGEMHFETSVCAATGTFSAEGTYAYEGEDAIRDVLLTTAALKNPTCEPKENGVQIDGELAFSAVVSIPDASGKIRYDTIKPSENISNFVKLDCQIPQDCRAEVRYRVIDAEGKLNEDRLVCNANIQYSVWVIREGELTRLERCDRIAEGTIGREPATVTVYYPESGDTLWSVAKRFHVAPSTIAATNALRDGEPDGSLAEVARLIIF